MMVVVPPAMALREPVSHPSPVGAFFWARCTCESTPPGVIYAPSASTTFVLDDVGRDEPMHTILPSLMPSSRPAGRTSLAVTCYVSVRNSFLDLRDRLVDYVRTMMPPLTTVSKSIVGVSILRTQPAEAGSQISPSPFLLPHKNALFSYSRCSHTLDNMYSPATAPLLGPSSRVEWSYLRRGEAYTGRRSGAPSDKQDRYAGRARIGAHSARLRV